MTPVIRATVKTTPWSLTVLLASALLVALFLLVIAPLAMAATPQESAPATDQQQDPLAAAARRTREQKQSQSKSPKVWDNDNVPTSGMINVVGQTPGTSSDANAAAPNPAAAATAPAPAPATISKDQLAALQSDVTSAKEQVESLKSDLDIMLRKYTLDDQSYHGKPDFASDKAGQAALDDEKAQIETKQQDFAAAQQRLDDLQAQLAAAASSASAPAGIPATQNSK